MKKEELMNKVILKGEVFGNIKQMCATVSNCTK